MTGREVLRAADPVRDRDAVQRIQRELGWLDPAEDDSIIDLILGMGPAQVAEHEGQVECAVTTAPGSLRHGESDLDLVIVTGVLTSRVARRRGLAARLTARAVAQAAAARAPVAALGTFDQGFYDRLGFGTGSYEHFVTFAPDRLRVADRPRPPRRVGPEDWVRVHANRLERRRVHGACNVLPAAFTRIEMLKSKNGFGLGYAAEGGALSHHLWCFTKRSVEHGPYRVRWLAWRTPEQFRELVALLASLGDQLVTISMREPPGLQLQDLIDRPFASQRATSGGEYEQGVKSIAYWQMRICDLPRCVAHARLPGPPARFNLELSDPIADRLPEDAPWRGVAGDYVVTLGPQSSAEPGRAPGLDTLSASVGAFTRLWLGVRPASGLALTDDLAGPQRLIEALDRAVRLPPPKPDWDF